MKRDLLGWLAMGASIAVTAQSEWALAVASGYHPVVAGALPVAIDAYVIRALRSGREVLPAVLAMVATNSAAHLLRGGMVTMSPWLVVAVSAIAPLVLWRVHALADEVSTPDFIAGADGVHTMDTLGGAGEGTHQASALGEFSVGNRGGDDLDAVEPIESTVADAPYLSASDGAGLGDSITVERLPFATRMEPRLGLVPWPQLAGASVPSALHPPASAAGQTALNAEQARGQDGQYGAPHPAAGCAPEPADAPADEPTLGDIEPKLLAVAQTVNRAAHAETGRPASLRRLQSELRIGQPRAQQLRRILADVDRGDCPQL